MLRLSARESCETTRSSVPPCLGEEVCSSSIHHASAFALLVFTRLCRGKEMKEKPIHGGMIYPQTTFHHLLKIAIAEPYIGDTIARRAA